MRHIFELFLLFTAWMALTDGYIYRKYIRFWKKTWLKCLYFLPSLLLFIGMAIVFIDFEPKPRPMHHFSIFLIFFLCIQVPKLLFMLTNWLLKPILASALALSVMGYLIFGATLGKEYYQVKEVTIASEDIPEGFDGYRIIQISDIHCGSWGENTRPLQKAVELINAQQADLIVFTGDLVNNLTSELEAHMPALSQLKAKDGVYSVMGNHDYSMYIPWDSDEAKAKNEQALRDKEAQMGWTLLSNRHVKLYQQNDSIALIGVENSGRPPFPDKANLNEAMAGTEGMFKILLSHDPSHWRREVLPETDIQLMLSGHTHAMQTKIFGFTPSRFVYPENDGLYQEGKQMLYVNIGLGHLLFPMRLGAWPEITLLKLKRK